MSQFAGFVPFPIMEMAAGGRTSIERLREMLHPVHGWPYGTPKLAREASEWMVQEGINHCFHCTSPARVTWSKVKKTVSIWMFVEEAKAPILRLYFPDLKPHARGSASS